MSMDPPSNGAANAVVGCWVGGARGCCRARGKNRDERGWASGVDAKLEASPSNAAKVTDRRRDRMVA